PTVSFGALTKGQSIGLGERIAVTFGGYPIASATYVVDGDAPRDLPPPFQIPTTNWTAGIHTIAVDAVDAYGQHGGASIALVEDIAPPAIQDVQVSKVNDHEYRVVVKASADA